ncbi:tR-splicing endonuclease subunit Sen2 [Daphnia sinensis]|uniref:tRNA-splicing endonuclease subunit Sen2 n=1 Tax=Daphnia sinensis TaxID=1820382 RepID=A0AAD5LDD3_9CRUS|nr:tR-splicing endonuclease subunit Sen2 [Daphnia sinensis]
MSKENFFKRKKGFGTVIYSPSSPPNYYIVGRFNGCSVEIEDVEQKQLLYSYGCFGKGNLSRSLPNFKSSVNDVSETSNLMVEEAFFLSYVVGCLQVKFEEKFLNLDEIWDLFMKTTNNFLSRYLSYQHFRLSGWVVRSGLKFGGDFSMLCLFEFFFSTHNDGIHFHVVLYKQGPEFHHASYSVVVRDQNTSNENSDSWIQLATVNRITESVSKELLLCDVVPMHPVPQLTTPECLRHLRLNVVVLKRWVSAQERIID